MKLFSADWWLKHLKICLGCEKCNKCEMDNIIKKYSEKYMKSQEEMMNDIDALAKEDGLTSIGYGTGLFIGSSGDRDNEIEMRIHHVSKIDSPNVLRKASTYINARIAKEIIEHLNKTFGFSE